MCQEMISQPNWTQIVSAFAAGLSLIVSVIVVYLLYKLKIQLDLKANQVQSYVKLLERMENIRSDRQLIRKFISSKKETDGYAETIQYWENQDLISKDTTVEYSDENGKISRVSIKDILSKVTREFDILGFMDRSKFISQEMVDQFYAAPLVDFTPIFFAYIKLLRTKEIPKRDETHLWELEQFMDRIKYVKGNHPGYHGKKAWPRDPRKKQAT
jgi:hypothetical protein